MLRCPVCDTLQTDPPRTLPEPMIDLRAPEPSEEAEQLVGDVVGDVLHDPAGDLPTVRPEPFERPTPLHLRPPEPAPRTIRVLAGVADWLVLTMFVYLPTFAFLRTDRADGSSTVSDLGRWVVTGAPFLYALLLVGATGATLGKRLFSIHVRDLNGNPCGWRAATVRAVIPSAVSLVGTALPTSPLFDSAIGAWISSLWFLAVYVPLLFDPRRQGLHDRLAGTLVMTRPLRRRSLRS